MESILISVTILLKLNIVDLIGLLYEGHPISSDNGLISQKLLLLSELYYPLHVAVGFAYSCLKFGVFITTWVRNYNASLELRKA